MSYTSYKKRKRKYGSSVSSKPTRNGQRFNHKNRRPGRKPSTLDPNLLVRKATETVIAEYRSGRTIFELPVHRDLIRGLERKGFERPTEIQDRTLETLLQGRDLLGIAQTGTGKTGAFLMPIVDQLLSNRRDFYALVVVPTRELAIQVQDEFKSIVKDLGLYSSCFIGGTNMNKDISALRRPSHIIIGTPGRLLDLSNRRVLDLRKFQTLVLDEFDRMLDMGFVHDVRRILKGMHQRQHTMLFSATLDKSQQVLIDSILTDPVSVKVSEGNSTADNVDQDIIRVVPGEDKFELLYQMICNPEFDKVLLFEETKHKANRLCMKLRKAGIASDQIHGNKSQSARVRALDAFKKGDIRVLVATDVAARGIDVSDVSHVINYQVPQTFDSYIHRIGRTGRAGKSGKALTFVG